MDLNVPDEAGAVDAPIEKVAELQRALGRKPRIVIIDDDAKFCHLMEYIGIQHGLLVTVYDSLEDLELPTVLAADVVAIDFNLGARNGVDVTEELKRKNVTVPVLLISASQDAFRLERWTETILGFTSKELGPFALLDSLLQILKSRLGQKEAPARQAPLAQ